MTLIPLAVYDSTESCTGGRLGFHDVRLVTDGTVAHAYVIGGHDVTETIQRDGVHLTTTCPQADRYDEPCGAEVAWRIDADAWTTNVDARALLAAAPALDVERVDA